VVDTATITRRENAPDIDEARARQKSPEIRSTAELSRRRFIIAVIVGTAIVLPPLLWVLWDLWSGTVNPLRAVPYDNFYDLQARAMFHGHLNIAPGNMGIEAFVHHGRQFTYFGVFPSLLRMPILLVTSSLDRQLTAPSILLAWMSTGLFTSLALWRLRILIRGRALLGRAEAASLGVLMATIMGGSVILYLSATPFVYNEDFAWSVPLTIGSLFALLGVMEKPTWGRVVASGVLIVATNLDRTPAGYASVIGALLIAGRFALGRGGESNRRWALPVAAIAAVIPFLANAVFTYGKFGIPVGLPMADQVWATVNAHRRHFLAANNGKAFSFAFLPSTVWAYFQPAGLHLSGVFPFITPPTAPAAALNGAVLDQTYPTASIPATMPLLFLLSCWGLVTSFRPRAFGQAHLTRIILVAAATGAGGVLLWGYISERYMADFMPFLILASGIGLIDIWRRLEARPKQSKDTALGVLGAFALFSIVANVAIAAGPVAQWTTAQTAGFVSLQRSISGQAVSAGVQRGATLPYWAPAGQLFAVNNCSGLYLSTGNNNKDVPGQQIQHYTWIPVQQSPSFTHTIGFTFNGPESNLTGPVPLMTYGASTLVLEPAGAGYARMRLENSGTSIDWPPAAGWHFRVTPDLLHKQLTIGVTIDPNLQSMVVTWYGSRMIGHYVAGNGPYTVKTTPHAPNAPLPLVMVAGVHTQKTGLNLCRSLAQVH
jgi:hypothetical protein